MPFSIPDDNGSNLGFYDGVEDDHVILHLQELLFP